MPRKKRIWYPGAIYHVMNRGNRRLILYNDEEDYLSFLESIQVTARLYTFKIHSLCLMTNHFHMIVETAETELWRIMKRMLHPYAVNFNRKYHYTGHLFENRYTACLIEDERYFLEVSRYIHLNPVRAQMVSNPMEYEYSSYGSFIDAEWCYGEKTAEYISEIVDTSRILDYFGHDSRRQYREFVEGRISHADQERQICSQMHEDDMWLPK
ncbi:MAG: transposase [Lachnospiraceae bacterium]|nr:transposase [Lachnospiraceae bacterium]